jgi:hypothetical protein
MPDPLPVAPVPTELVRKYAGWYEPISPRVERMQSLVRILGLTKLSLVYDGLSLRGLNNRKRNFVPVTDRLFRLPGDGAPTLALIADQSEGMLMEVGGQTFRRIPAWLPWLEVAMAAAAALLMLSSLAFALVWVPRKLFGRMRTVACIRVRAMPVLATLSIVCGVLVTILAGEDSIQRLGRITPWSVGYFVSTSAFAVFAVLGLVLTLRCRNRPIRRWVWWHAFAAALVLTVMVVYLSYWGFIGWRPWA